MEWITLLEWLASFAGLINIYLLTRLSVWAWPAGLISVSIFVLIFLKSHLYSDFVLHIIYVALNIYGWYNWTLTNKEGSSLQISKLKNIHRILILIFISLGFLIWGYNMQRHTNADFAYPDAFILVASLVAQYLLALKKWENWVIWLAVDIVAVIIYFQKSLFITSGLYGIYFILCLFGLREWLHSMKPKFIQ